MPELYDLVRSKCAAVELARERGDVNALGDADWLAPCRRMLALTKAARVVEVTSSAPLDWPTLGAVKMEG